MQYVTRAASVQVLDSLFDAIRPVFSIGDDLVIVSESGISVIPGSSRSLSYPLRAVGAERVPAVVQRSYKSLLRRMHDGNLTVVPPGELYQRLEELYYKRPSTLRMVRPLMVDVRESRQAIRLYTEFALPLSVPIEQTTSRPGRDAYVMLDGLVAAASVVFARTPVGDVGLLFPDDNAPALGLTARVDGYEVWSWTRSYPNQKEIAKRQKRSQYDPSWLRDIPRSDLRL